MILRIITVVTAASILWASAVEAAHHHLNDTCIDLKFKELSEHFDPIFQEISQIPNYDFAQILSPNAVHVRWTRADDGKRRSYSRTLNFEIHEKGGQHIHVDEGALRVMDGLQLMDFHTGSGSSAHLYINDNGEQYLTVNTSNAQTSCTLRLNMYSNLHGKVMSDDIFGTLKFSPNGKLIMYVAEAPVNSRAQFLYLGTFGESQRVSRPKVFLYNVENQTFKMLETIPDFYSAGELSWRSDSSGIVGTVWGNHPFPMGCPGCANRKSQVI